MDVLTFLLPAAALCVLMALSHAWFGLHVLARGIVFVDLALAQVAALGVSVAFLLGEDAHGEVARLYALGAALIAALGFSLLRRLPDKTTREVAIGCVYVVATALFILILSRSAPGMDELRLLLSGNILWVRWREVGEVAAAYALLALPLAFFHRRFERLSADRGRGAFLWELAFFAAFAVAITLAVRLAGVLLVFAFLIIPAFSAVLLAARPAARLLLAWALALVGAAAGLLLSLAADLPTGPTLVVALGLLPVAAGLARLSRSAR
jgi:zinc/manganese transport system permease protein